MEVRAPCMASQIGMHQLPKRTTKCHVHGTHCLALTRERTCACRLGQQGVRVRGIQGPALRGVLGVLRHACRCVHQPAAVLHVLRRRQPHLQAGGAPPRQLITLWADLIAISMSWSCSKALYTRTTVLMGGLEPQCSCPCACMLPLEVFGTHVAAQFPLPSHARRASSLSYVSGLHPTFHVCAPQLGYQRLLVTEHGRLSGRDNMKAEIQARGPITCTVNATMAFDRSSHCFSSAG